MKKNFMKFTKILVLIAMIFSDLMTPISVLANEITNRDPVKGDVGIDNKVTNNGEMATVSVGSTKEKGGVKNIVLADGILLYIAQVYPHRRRNGIVDEHGHNGRWASSERPNVFPVLTIKSVNTRKFFSRTARISRL